jgi:uncharacterized protein (UPF0276 family)
MSFGWASLPRLGVGLGYRKELHDHYFQHRDRVDWLELIGDHYVDLIAGAERRGEAVDLAAAFPVIPHFLEHSVGSHGPIEEPYCQAAAALVRATRAPYATDHLCFTKAGGIELGGLTIVPFTASTADRCAARARAIQETLGVPFLLENIYYPFSFPGELSELAFINRVLEGSGCGMLLDLANLFINAENHAYDPHAFIEGLPAERIVQVHLAGSERRDGRWVDTHSQSVEEHPQVWDLLEHLLRRAPVKAILVERDQNFPADFGEILHDLDRAREFFSRATA